MALPSITGNNAFLAQALAIRDLPPEIQEQIRAQAETFSEGDLDTIDTPNEQRALQKLLLGLDPSLINSNPQLQQLQQFAQQTADPTLLVEMIKNAIGRNQQGNAVPMGNNSGGMRNMGGQGFSNPARNLGPGAWNGNASSGANNYGGATNSAASNGPAAASYPAGNLNGDRGQQAMTYLQNELGITEAQAAGIVGNLGVESGGDLDPTAIGDGGNAMGIAQWNGPRMRDLQAFAAQQGKPATDFGVQLQFLAHELKTSESGALASLRRTSTASEAALAFSRDFERPGIPHNDRRVALANQAFQQFA